MPRKFLAGFLCLVFLSPSPAHALRPEPISQTGGLEELRQAMQAGSEEIEEPEPKVRILKLKPGQVLTEELLRSEEREAFVGQISGLIRENFQQYPPDKKVLWDVGAFTGEVSARLLPLFLEAAEDRVIAFEKSPRSIRSLREKAGPHFQIVEGDFRKYVEEEGQEPTVILASHVLYYFQPKERRDILEYMFNVLPPGRPAFIVLNDTGKRKGGRNHLRTLLLGEDRAPLDPESIQEWMYNRHLDRAAIPVTLEIQGNFDQIVQAARLFLGAERTIEEQDLASYVRTYCAAPKLGTGSYALSAGQVILSGMKPMPPESVRLPPRMQELLRKLTEAPRNRLFLIMTDQEMTEETQLKELWRFIEKTKPYAEMTPQDREALFREVGHPERGPLVDRGKFADKETLLNLLHIAVGRGDVRGVVSADSDLPSEVSLPSALIELRAFARFLEPADQKTVEGLFHRVILQDVPMVRREEVELLDVIVRRLMGPPRDPRLFSRREIKGAYGNLDQYIDGGFLPLSIRRTLEAGGNLRFSEVEEIFQEYQKQYRRRPPLSLNGFLQALRQDPLPRLVSQLPPLDDREVLWTPFQIELLQDYTEAKIAAMWQRSGEKQVRSPDWGWDAGVRGVEDFPADLREPLRKAASVTERVFVIVDYLGWNDRQLELLGGIYRHALKTWSRFDVKDPFPFLIPRIASALRVHPLFLLTGQGVREALKEGPPSRRAKLLLKANGLSQKQAGERLGMTQPAVQRTLKSLRWDRETLFEWASCLEVEPALLEFGKTAPHARHSLELHDLGFKQKIEKEAREYAQELHSQLLAQMERLRDPEIVGQWKPLIDPAGTYPGLTVKLLSAKPDTMRRMVQFGFPGDVGERLKNRTPLTAAEVKRLALYLIHTHDELEQLFVSAPEYSPQGVGGYGNKSQHIFHTWDLVVRGMTAPRLMSIAGRAQVTLGQLKSKILAHPDPEGEIAAKEKLLEELLEDFGAASESPVKFSSAAIRNYVWAAKDPAAEMAAAIEQYAELQEAASRRWILPVSPSGRPGAPEAFAKLMVGHPFRSGPFLERFHGRVGAVREALQGSPSAKELGGFVTMLSPLGLAAYVSDLTAVDEDFLAAEDFLHRVIAYRQAADPRFPQEVTQQQAAQWIDQTVQALGETPGKDFPKESSQLEPFLSKLSERLTAGMEEQWLWKEADEWELLRGGTARLFLETLSGGGREPVISWVREPYEGKPEEAGPLWLSVPQAKAMLRQSSGLLVALHRDQVALLDMEEFRQNHPEYDALPLVELTQRAMDDLFVEPLTRGLERTSPEGLQALLKQAEEAGLGPDLPRFVARRAIRGDQQVSPGPVVGLAAGSAMFFSRGWDRESLRWMLRETVQQAQESRETLPVPPGVRKEMVEGVLNGQLALYPQLSADEKQHLRQLFFLEFTPRQTGVDRFLDAPAKSYPLTTDSQLLALIERADKLTTVHPRGRIFSLGRSMLWLVETARLTDFVLGRPNRYGYVAFSGRWKLRQFDPISRQYVPGKGQPSPEQVQAYRKYLAGIGMDPATIIRLAEEQDTPTVLVEYPQKGGSLLSFLGLLSDWAQELGVLEELKKGLALHLIEEGRLRPITIPEGFRVTRQSMTREGASRQLADGLSNSDVYEDSPGRAYPFQRWLQETPPPLGAEITPRAALVEFRILDTLLSTGAEKGVRIDGFLVPREGLRFQGYTALVDGNPPVVPPDRLLPLLDPGRVRLFLPRFQMENAGRVFHRPDVVLQEGAVNAIQGAGGRVEQMPLTAEETAAYWAANPPNAGDAILLEVPPGTEKEWVPAVLPAGVAVINLPRGASSGMNFSDWSAMIGRAVRQGGFLTAEAWVDSVFHELLVLDVGA